MKKIFYTKKALLISIFFLTILSLTIGYAFLNSNIKINGSSDIAANTWNISFSNIIENACNATAIESANIGTNNNSINLNVEFNKEKDFYDFIVDVTNTGTIDAMIDSITSEGLKDDDNIFYSLTYLDGSNVSQNDTLSSNETKKIRIIVGQKNQEAYTSINEKNYSFTININYVQIDEQYANDNDVDEDSFDMEDYLDGSTCNNEIKIYTLTIDPDGGLYNGKNDVSIIGGLFNKQVYKIPTIEPEKEGYSFEGWIAYNSEDYVTNYNADENTITINEGNAYIKATYKENIGPYSLTIDPNGGIYNGSSEIVIKENLRDKKVINLGNDPTKEGSLFIGWEPTNDENYTTIYDDLNNNVTIRGGNAYVTAKYGEAVARVENSEHEIQGYYASLSKAFRAANPGYTIYLLKNIEEDAINYLKDDRETNHNEVILDLNSFKVTGQIINYDYLNIINGTIENTTKTTLINNGILTIGTNDETVTMNDIAVIGPTEAGGIALEQKGTFNFYDGYLEANIGLKGGYDEIPEEYIVFVDHLKEPDRQKVYLSKTDRSVAKTIIDEKPIYYLNLQDAFNTAMESEELLPVYAIRDFEAAYILNINANKEVLFDIVGYTVETGYDIINNGTFTITDSATTKGKLVPSITITNNNILNIKDISIEETTSANIITNSKILNLDNTILKAKDGYAISNTSEGIINSSNEINITGDNDYAIYNNGTNGIINANINTQTNRIILNDGKLTIKENALLKLEKDTSSQLYGIYNSSGNRQTILDGGHIIVTSINKRNNVYGIYNNASDDITTTINSGTIDVNGYSAYGVGYYENYATIIMNNGIINVDSSNSAYGLIAYRLTMNGGTINVNAHDGGSSSRSYGIYSNGYINIDGGTINAYTTSTEKNAVGIRSESRYEFNVKDITINSDGNCINQSNSNSFEPNIMSGNLTCGNNGINVVYNSNINGININAENYGIYKESGSNYTLNIGTNNEYNNEINIKGGKSGIYINDGITNINRGAITGSTEYGIYSKAGTTTIGNDDGTVSQTIPNIIGEKHGIYIDGGTINFYDGILKGQTDSYYGLISGVADGTELSDDTENIDGKDYFTSYLIEYDNFIKVGNVEYNSLNKAIAAISETGTMELIKSADIKAPVTVPSGKNIKLKMNNYSLNVSKQILNNGTFTITDDEENNAKITCTLYECFKNTGTMNISDFDIDGIDRLVNNSGAITFKNTDIDVNVTNTDTSNYNYGVIYNTKDVTIDENANFNITISRYEYHCIYNNSSTAKVELNGGTIKVVNNYSNGSNGLSGAIYQANNDASVIINDGLIDVSSYKAYGIFGYGTNSDSGKVEMNGGTVKVRPAANDASWGNAYGICADYFKFTAGTIDASGISYTIGALAYRTDITGGNILVKYVNTTNTNRSAWGLKLNGGYYNHAIDNLIINSDDSCIYSSSYIGYKATINGGTYNCENSAVYTYSDTIINGGIFTSKKETIKTNENDANVTINGGTFTSEESYGVYYNKGYYNTAKKLIIGDITLETKPTITGATYGIYLEKGEADIVNADIKGVNNSGVYSKDVLNIGTISDPINVTSPAILGNSYGLEINSGTTNFYGGIIKGIEDGYTGFISGYPDGYSLTEGTETIEGTLYKTNYLDEYTNFVKVGETEYNSLNKAIESIEETGTMELIASANIKSEVTIPSGKNITLKMNNKTLNVYKQIINNGTFEITDDEGNTNSGITCQIYECFNNTGTLNLSRGTIDAIDRIINNTGSVMLENVEVNIEMQNRKGESNASEASIYNKGNITINNNANITINSTVYKTYGISNEIATSRTIMNGGILKIINNYSDGINGYAVGIYHSNNDSQTEINGGTIDVEGYYAYGTAGSGSYGSMGRTGNVYMDGGAIKVSNPGDSGFASAEGILAYYVNYSAGDIIINGSYDATGINASRYDISGGNIEATYNKDGGSAWGLYTEGMYNYNSVIDNINIDTNGTCLRLYTNSDSKIEINDGIFNCGNNAINTYYGKVYIKGGTFNSTKSAIYAKDCNTLEITGGTFISSSEYGLYSNIGCSSSSYYINIGEKGNGIDTGSPMIQGKSYGVYISNGKVNFYDGRIKGQTETHYGDFTTLEDNAMFRSETETIDGEPYKVKYLVVQSDIVRNLNKNEDNTYNNLQTAISSASSGDNLELIDNASLYYELTIPSGKTINLDTKGYTIMSSNPIINNGTFNISDSSSEKTSIIRCNNQINLITNNGTLNIDDVDISYSSSSKDYYPVTNNNTATFTNTSISKGYYGIRNNENGVLNINNGNIEAINTSIYNYGDLEIDGGTYSGDKYGVYQYTTVDNEIKNATINSSDYAIYKYSGSAAKLTLTNNNLNGEIYNSIGTINISGGTITDQVINHSSLTINNTDISGDYEWSYAIYNYSNLELNAITSNINSFYNDSGFDMINNKGSLTIQNSTINITRNKFYGTTIIYNYDGTYLESINNKYYINHTGGDSRTSSNGIYNPSSGSNIISDGDLFDIKGTSAQIYGIYNQKADSDNIINNATINVSGNLNAYGIYSSGGTITMEKGTIEVTGNNAYGIYIDGENAEMIIGHKETENIGTATTNVSITNPSIKAIGTTTGYGVRKINGLFKYYDGILIGSTDAKPDTTSDVEYKYEATTYYDDSEDKQYYYCILEFMDSQNGD